MTTVQQHRLAVAGQGIALVLFAGCYAADPSPYWAFLMGWSAYWGAKSSHWLASHRPAKPAKPSIEA
jgi:hypothetical protein